MNTHTTQDIPFIPAPRITTVAGYLLTRLAEAGLASVFGVPGDDNLPILDAIADRPDLAWIGMATEQGAGYAADSYAVWKQTEGALAWLAKRRDAEVG